MKNEKLMRAMGEIDEDLIIEAREVKKSHMKWVHFGALAACLAIVLLCSPVLMVMFFGAGGKGAAEMEADNDFYYSEDYAEVAGDRVTALEGKTEGVVDGIKDAEERLENTTSDGALAPDIKYALDKLQDAQGLVQCQVGATVKTDGAALTYQSSDARTVSFHIKKETAAPLVLSVAAYSDGEGAWKVSSDGEDSHYLRLTVNGEKVTELPETAGSYNITVDLSALLNRKNTSVSDWLVVEGICVLVRGTGE